MGEFEVATGEPSSLLVVSVTVGRCVNTFLVHFIDIYSIRTCFAFGIFSRTAWLQA
jgi:hypothetical protein